MFLSQTGNNLLLFTLGKQPFQLRSVMLGLDEKGKSSRKLCGADFVLEAVGTFAVCTAAGGHVRQGAGLSCLKAREKNNNFINRQVFDFQTLAAVSEPKSGKGFRQYDLLFFG